LSNGASTSNTSPSPSTSPFSRTCGVFPLLPRIPRGEAWKRHRQANHAACFYRYPGPTLKALDLVQQEQFRKDILRPDVVENLTNAWMAAYTAPRE
jgi:hypothetical protein